MVAYLKWWNKTDTRWDGTSCKLGITLKAASKVLINVLAPRAFNAESQYFIPLFNKISLLCGQQPGGDEASNEGATLAQEGVTLRVILLY